MQPTNELRLKARERPNETPIVHQNWRKLLFLHWKFDPEYIQSTLPKELTVDTYEGVAYVGIIPFLITDLKISNKLSLPTFFSKLYEMNVRTYVYDKNGTPGVWFYSLDINSAMATMAGRSYFYLPYLTAEISVKHAKELVDFTVSREANEQARYVYAAQEEIEIPTPASLNFFLIERYILFAASDEKILSCQVNHKPYPLAEVDVRFFSEDPIRWNNLKTSGLPPDHAIYSPGVDVDIFNPKIIDRS